jgi:DNA-directed RNA polymerase specialized sigma24 family protein
MRSPTDLDGLLLWLGSDRDAGARRYVEVRQKLATLFECRGCQSPEDLADETLDRTARAILKPGFSFEGDIMAYLLGVARNVYLESLRKKRTISQEAIPGFADRTVQTQSDDSRKEVLLSCLDRCLGRLPTDKRSLLLRYYQGEKTAKIDGRLRLAEQEGLELNALRIQIFRLRNLVRECVESCTKA